MILKNTYRNFEISKNKSERERSKRRLLLVAMKEAKEECRPRGHCISRAHTPHEVIGHTCSRAATNTYQYRHRYFQKDGKAAGHHRFGITKYKREHQGTKVEDELKRENKERRAEEENQAGSRVKVRTSKTNSTRVHGR